MNKDLEIKCAKHLFYSSSLPPCIGITSQHVVSCGCLLPVMLVSLCPFLQFLCITLFFLYCNWFLPLLLYLPLPFLWLDHSFLHFKLLLPMFTLFSVSLGASPNFVILPLALCPFLGYFISIACTLRKWVPWARMSFILHTVLLHWWPALYVCCFFFIEMSLNCDSGKIGRYWSKS